MVNLLSYSIVTEQYKDCKDLPFPLDRLFQIPVGESEQKYNTNRPARIYFFSIIRIFFLSMTF
jgi:hypothetical protein